MIVGREGSGRTKGSEIRASPAAASQVRPPARGRLLLAAADSHFRRLLSAPLQLTAHEVVEVGNVVDLLEAVAGSRAHQDDLRSFDLVLLDVRMQGWEAFEAAAQHGDGSSVPPLIVIASLGNPGLRSRARTVGAVAIFDRPFDISDLCLFVREYLELAAR